MPLCGLVFQSRTSPEASDRRVLGTISLWTGDAADLETVGDSRDKRGKEGLTAGDVRWTADIRPEGLLVGMGVQSNRMASPPGFEPGFQP